MNLPESVFYWWYLYVVLRQLADWSYEGLTRLEVRGKDVDLALLLVFSAAVMTVSKSILYCECSLSKPSARLLMISRAE